jgi:hypothetical protein
VAVTPEQAEEDDRTRAARGLSFVGAALAVLFVASVITQLPAGLVPDPISAQREAFRLVWPQGWRLYTDSAAAEFTVVYHLDESTGAVTQATRLPVDADYLWGLSRSAYGDLVRHVSTVGTIPRTQWRDCAAPSVSACAEVISAAPRVPVPSRYRPGFPCGPAVFAIERPSRWHEQPPGGGRHLVRLAVVDLVCSA